jgi:hypothetical protein
MEGVILFADDKIHQYDYDIEQKKYAQSDENKLFKNLAENYPVLGVKDLVSAQKTLNSIGTFSALILDWQFESVIDTEQGEIEEDDDAETVRLVKKSFDSDLSTFNFLMQNDVYSLIYIYSTAASEIEAFFGDKLREKYNTRVQIKDKKNISDTGKEAGTIIEDLKNWTEHNKNLSVPIMWNHSINKATQHIFLDLITASPRWVKDLYDSACDRNGSPIVDPIVEIINLFQNLLSEKLIQDFKLRELIKNLVEADNKEETSVESYVKLFEKFFYSSTFDTDPLMTGDIICFDKTNNTYGILITPECDVADTIRKKDLHFEFLIFNDSAFKNNAKNLFRPITTKKIEYSDEQTRELLIKAFNQNEGRFHLLPSFPFTDSKGKTAGLIDFKLSIRYYKYSELTDEAGKLKDRQFKFNSPYIQQLRQRYLAYKGRVGVPAPPSSLINWNINLQ